MAVSAARLAQLLQDRLEKEEEQERLEEQLELQQQPSHDQETEERVPSGGDSKRKKVAELAAAVKSLTQEIDHLTQMISPIWQYVLTECPHLNYPAYACEQAFSVLKVLQLNTHLLFPFLFIRTTYRIETKIMSLNQTYKKWNALVRRKRSAIKTQNAEKSSEADNHDKILEELVELPLHTLYTFLNLNAMSERDLTPVSPSEEDPELAYRYRVCQHLVSFMHNSALVPPVQTKADKEKQRQAFLLLMATKMELMAMSLLQYRPQKQKTLPQLLASLSTFFLTINDPAVKPAVIDQVIMDRNALARKQALG